jgi:HK97 family phage major capsid protein
MPINMNLVRLSNQLEQVKGDVAARVERSKDDHGNPNSEVFRAKNSDITESLGEWLQARTQEAQQLQSQIDDYLKTEQSLENFDTLLNVGKEKANRPFIPQQGEKFHLADAMFKADDWDDFVEKKSRLFSIDSKASMKTLFETTTPSTLDNVSVESVRTGEYIMAPRTRVTLLDLIPQLPTEYPVVKYDVEVKNESNANPIAQGAVYQESAFQVDEVSVNVSKTGTFIQTSEELLADRPQFRQRLDSSLMQQLMRRIQADLIGGAPLPASEYVGTPTDNANVRGFLNLTNTTEINFIDGQAGDNPIQRIEEAAEQVYRIGEAEADAILMSSQDWVKMKTLQSTTGAFILRGANAPVSQPVARSIDEWPVVLCNALAPGTVLMGAFSQFCAIRDRQSVQVRIQEAQQVPVAAVNTPVFTQPAGRYNIFADVRYAFAVTRGLAFTKITGFAT